MFSRAKSKTRNCKKWIPEAALNVAAVSKGLKPAFLWDVSNDSPEDVHKFVQRLRLTWTPTQSSLHRLVDVLILNGDIFILSLERTIERLETLIDSRTVLFVDVSDRCQFLERDSPGYAIVVKTITDLTYQLKKCISHHHKRDRTNLNIFEVNCPENWNLTTVNGILLGYPIVYWFTNIQEYDLHGALAMKPLCVYEMYLEAEETFIEDLKGEMNSANIPDMCPRFKLYSFSAPMEWSYQLEKHVQDWFDRIRIMRELSLYEEPVFKSLDLQTRTVVLASVTL